MRQKLGEICVQDYLYASKMCVSVCVHFSSLQVARALVSAAYLTPAYLTPAYLTSAQNLLITPEHLATLVVNTLFSAILGCTYCPIDMVPERMTAWFKAYR